MSPWFKLTGDARLGRCSSEGCGGQPTWRLEAGGVGSNYCSGCHVEISNPSVFQNQTNSQERKTP